MPRVNILRATNCTWCASRSLSTAPARAINRRNNSFSYSSSAPFVIQPGRPPKSPRKLFALLGASMALGGASLLYFLMTYKDHAITVPLYVHFDNTRGLLRNEMEESELCDLKSSIMGQLTARVAVDETIGSLLGVPCAVTLDEIELMVRAPGPSLICVQVMNDSKRGFTYRLIARSVLGSWWSSNSSSGNGTDIVRLNTQGELGGGSGPADSLSITGPLGARDPISASTDIEDAGAHKWDWDSSDQQIVIRGSAALLGPGPNLHVDHRREDRAGCLFFEASKSDEVGLRFKRSVLRYNEGDKEITQRLW